MAAGRRGEFLEGGLASCVTFKKAFDLLHPKARMDFHNTLQDFCRDCWFVVSALSWGREWLEVCLLVVGGLRGATCLLVNKRVRQGRALPQHISTHVVAG